LSRGSKENQAREWAHLARVIEQEPAFGQALLHPAPRPGDSVQPIKPLEIADLEVTPLSGQDR
jgi:hypothetical protein